jgi:hypothetical protein
VRGCPLRARRKENLACRCKRFDDGKPHAPAPEEFMERRCPLRVRGSEKLECRCKRFDDGKPLAATPEAIMERRSALPARCWALPVRRWAPREQRGEWPRGADPLLAPRRADLAPRSPNLASLLEKADPEADAGARPDTESVAEPGRGAATGADSEGDAGDSEGSRGQLGSSGTAGRRDGRRGWLLVISVTCGRVGRELARGASRRPAVPLESS